jgi:hypothetical protein
MKERTWDDLRWAAHPVTLIYRQRRVICRRCGIRTERIEFAEAKRVTRRLRQQIGVDCHSMPTSHAAVRHGVSWGKARRAKLVYVITDQVLDEFRIFLERHAPVFHALRAWTLRIVVPPHQPKVGQRAKQVVWNQLLTPLRAEVIDELRWYFAQARTHATPSRCYNLDERFYQVRKPSQHRASRRCTGCGSRTATGCSRTLVRVRSTMRYSQAQAGSKPSNSVTDTVTSLPWSMSPDRPRAPKWSVVQASAISPKADSTISNRRLPVRSPVRRSRSNPARTRPKSCPG